MRKRLKAILQTYESGELGQDRAARRIERLLDREIDRLEDQGRFWGAAGVDDDGDPVVSFRLDAPTIASPLGYLNRGLEFHKAVLDVAAPRNSLVARTERAVEAGRLTREEAEARLETVLERRIERRFDGRQEKQLLEAAERLDSAADALLDFRGFRKAAREGERFRPDDLDDAFKLLRVRASDLERPEPVVVPEPPEPFVAPERPEPSSIEDLIVFTPRDPIETTEIEPIFTPSPGDTTFPPPGGTLLPPSSWTLAAPGLVRLPEEDDAPTPPPPETDAFLF